MGLPCSSAGITGRGGARRRLPMSPTSSGASAMKSRRKPRTAGACSIGHTTMPASTVGPRGCSSKVKLVTMPKLPPPPRRPQNRSAFSSSLATTNSPSAVTTSHERRASMERPNLRMRWPMPPPRVRPPMPVWLTKPPVAASPKAWASRSRWALRQPPWAWIVRAFGVDPRPRHSRQVDHQPVVADGVAGDGVPAAPNGRVEALVAAEADGGDDVGHARAAGDQRRPALDVAVPDLADLVVVGGVGRHQPPLEPGGQAFDRRSRRWLGVHCRHQISLPSAPNVAFRP